MRRNVITAQDVLDVVNRRVTVTANSSVVPVTIATVDSGQMWNLAQVAVSNGGTTNITVDLRIRLGGDPVDDFMSFNVAPGLTGSSGVDVIMKGGDMVWCNIINAEVGKTYTIRAIFRRIK